MDYVYCRSLIEPQKKPFQVFLNPWMKYFYTSKLSWKLHWPLPFNMSTHGSQLWSFIRETVDLLRSFSCIWQTTNFDQPRKGWWLAMKTPRINMSWCGLPCVKSFIADDLFLLTRSKVSILTGPNCNLLNYTYQIDI